MELSDAAKALIEARKSGFRPQTQAQETVRSAVPAYEEYSSGRKQEPVQSDESRTKMPVVQRTTQPERESKPAIPGYNPDATTTRNSNVPSSSARAQQGPNGGERPFGAPGTFRRVDTETEGDKPKKITFDMSKAIPPGRGFQVTNPHGYQTQPNYVDIDQQAAEMKNARYQAELQDAVAEIDADKKLEELRDILPSVTESADRLYDRTYGAIGVDELHPAQLLASEIKDIVENPQWAKNSIGSLDFVHKANRLLDSAQSYVEQYEQVKNSIEAPKAKIDSVDAPTVQPGEDGMFPVEILDSPQPPKAPLSKLDSDSVKRAHDILKKLDVEYKTNSETEPDRVVASSGRTEATRTV